MKLDPNVYLTAIEVLDALGWAKGQSISSDGVCALGALRIALGEVPFEDDHGWPQLSGDDRSAAELFPYDAVLEDVLRARSDHPNYDYITTWNDDVAGTVEDVKQVFRDAAAIVTLQNSLEERLSV